VDNVDNFVEKYYLQPGNHVEISGKQDKTGPYGENREKRKNNLC